MKLSFHGTVKNHRFIADEPKEFARSFWEHEDKRVTVSVGRFQKDRSLKENRYYWGVVVEMIASNTGNDKDVIHEFLKAQFLKFVKYLAINGEMIEYTYNESTTVLSTVRFEQFLEECRVWALEKLSITIPLPNEVDLD